MKYLEQFLLYFIMLFFVVTILFIGVSKFGLATTIGICGILVLITFLVNM